MPDTLLLPPPSAPRTSARMRGELEQRARAACQSSYLGDHTSLCRVLGKHLCYVDTRDRHLAPHLIMNGFWEPWITVAIAQRMRPGMVCVDVGANLGYFTMLLADLVGPSGAVIAFEPNPRLRELCTSSISANGFRDRTCVSGFAASDRDGDHAEDHDDEDERHQHAQPENRCAGHAINVARRRVPSCRSARIVLCARSPLRSR